MRIIIIIFIYSILVACASNNLGQHDNSPFPYQIDRSIIDNLEYKRIIIAPTNLGKPSRKYLRPFEKRVDTFVEERLKEAGFQLLPSALFQDSWISAVRRFGTPYNSTTGKTNNKTYSLVLNDVFNTLKTRGNIDAVLFTDLIERQVNFTTGLQHVSRWDGVLRKPSTQGTGSGVPSDFNWNESIMAVSIWVNLYDMNLQQLFQSAGGIEITDALSLKGDAKFIRRRSLLSNRSHIEEGVSLALHPLVTMKGYKEKEHKEPEQNSDKSIK